MRLSRPITELRAEYGLIAEGDVEGDCSRTEYGMLINRLAEIATAAATGGWHNPDAFVTVDVDVA